MSLKALALQVLERNAQPNADRNTADSGGRRPRPRSRRPVFASDDLAAWLEERAAIIEHEAGAPRLVAEVIAALSVSGPPQGIDDDEWRALIDAHGGALDASVSAAFNSKETLHDEAQEAIREADCAQDGGGDGPRPEAGSLSARAGGRRRGEGAQ